MEARTLFAPRIFPFGPLPLPNLFPLSSSSVKILSLPHLLLKDQTFPTSAAKKFCSRAKHFDEERSRPLTKFPPSLWNDYFLSVSVNDSELHGLGREIDSLKPIVIDMLMASPGDAKEKIHLIYLLVNLGLSYHFDNEIEVILKHNFQHIENMIADEDDLYTISIMFWIFRLYGHNMSCGVFSRFKGDDGKFKTCLAGDVKGMLSLYEASHLGTTIEDIMDEALSFTLCHLESLAARASPHTATLIQNALYRPQYLDMEILFVRQYISFYEQEEEHNKMLLKLAKLNFKFLQLHYLQELKIVTKWWKDLDLTSKLPYVRDRMTESYFMALTIYFEPQYSTARIILGKFIMLMTVVDDTYDAYGTLSEVVSLTDAAERWDLDVIDKLPDSIKIVFSFLLDFFEELECLLAPQGRSYSVQDTKEELKRLMRGYLAVAKWARAGQVPTYEEYIVVGEVTGAVDVSVAGSFLGMGHISGREAYEWVKSRPKVLQALDIHARLMNDISTYKDEMCRGEVVNGINCYMKQYGVTEEEALIAMQKRLKMVYKIVNEEFLKTTAVPRQLLLKVLNFGRLSNVINKYIDGLTYPERKTKEWDPDVIDKLPNYIRIVFRFLLDFFEELECVLAPEGRSYSVQDTKEELKRGNLAIAKWARAGHVPTYEEYMEVGLVIGGIDVLAAGSFLGMKHIAGKEAYEWLKSRPTIIQALDIKSRLIDNIATYKVLRKHDLLFFSIRFCVSPGYQEHFVP